MSQLANQHLECFEGNSLSAENRVSSLDVRLRLGCWEADRASDAIEFYSNHLL
jgi:hypothetical protein